jgi:hypothetical protein
MQLYTLRLIMRNAARSWPKTSPHKVTRCRDDVSTNRSYYKLRFGNSIEDEPTTS